MGILEALSPNRRADRKYQREASRWQTSGNFDPLVVREYTAKWLQDKDTARMLAAGYVLMDTKTLPNKSKDGRERVRVRYKHHDAAVAFLYKTHPEE